MSRTLDQIGGTSGFRAVLLGTTSDATPHITMIFDWYTNTRSPECLCSLWKNTEKTRLPFYYLLVSLPRQDCRKVWVLLECLRTLDQIGGTSGFRDLCSIATWLQVTLVHLLPWIFEWCTRTHCHYFITKGHSSLDYSIPDKFLDIPSYMLAFGEKD